MATIAETAQGRLEGSDLGNQLVFKGVPFAAPPVGPLRWHPPAPAAPWSGVRPAKNFGNPSMQVPMENILPALTPLGTVSEDCLYLNVWTPGLDDGLRPVMVWIHGGAFLYGSGHETLPDRQEIVNRGDIVLVSLNYRLGPMGFLNLAELTGGRIPASGNEGLLDQVAALKWVRSNIKNFGGDPNNVTIFGESAGGMSVGALLGMPSAQGLFHRAIAQSGAAHTANPPDRMLRIAEKTLSIAGTRDPEALMDLSSQQCLDLELKFFGGSPMQDDSAWHTDFEIGSQPFQPCVDGQILPDLPIRSVAKGLAAGVSVLVGSTADETKAFAYAEPSMAELTDDKIRTFIGHIPGIDGLIAGYREALGNRGAQNSPLDVFAQLVSDRQFRIPGIRLAETQSEHSDAVYSYMITWPSPTMGGAMGAVHGIEIGALFSCWDTNEASRDFFGSGPEMETFSTTLQDVWSSFARTGEPGAATIQSCPTYDTQRRATLMLGRECAVEDAPYEEERKLWDGSPDEAIGEY